MTKPHEEWLYFAKQDIAFAEAGFREGFYAHVCYLSQQTVEKAMKGYLVSQGKSYPKTHGLITLHRLMEVNWLDDHIDALKKLSEFYTPLRYPDAMAGALSSGLPDKDDAGNALSWAQNILAVIENHL